MPRTLDDALQNSSQDPCRSIVRNCRSFYLFPVTHDEILKIISNLKLTSTGTDTIPVRLFKSIKHLISDPLIKIINVSFSKGIFPECFKLAKITPVFKKNDRKYVSNYRPISCLPYISKIFERCFTNRIVSFFEKFSLFSTKKIQRKKIQISKKKIRSRVKKKYVKRGQKLNF